MNLRLIGVCFAAAIAGSVFAWLLYTLVAGGGGDESAAVPDDDPRTPRVLAFVPQQVEKLGASGPGAIYGVLDFGVQAQCSQEEFAAAMEDQLPIGAFREVKEITYNDDGTADVQVILITETGDVEVTWRLSFLPNNLPKILELPGSDECTPP